MEPRRGKPNHCECGSEPDRFPTSLDRTQKHGLRGAVWESSSPEVEIERMDRGDEDAGERSELLNSAFESQDLRLEILLFH